MISRLFNTNRSNIKRYVDSSVALEQEVMSPIGVNLQLINICVLVKVTGSRQNEPEVGLEQ